MASAGIEWLDPTVIEVLASYRQQIGSGAAPTGFGKKINPWCWQEILNTKSGHHLDSPGGPDSDRPDSASNLSGIAATVVGQHQAALLSWTRRHISQAIVHCDDPPPSRKKIFAIELPRKIVHSYKNTIALEKDAEEVICQEFGRAIYSTELGEEEHKQFEFQSRPKDPIEEFAKIFATCIRKGNYPAHLRGAMRISNESVKFVEGVIQRLTSGKS